MYLISSRMPCGELPGSIDASGPMIGTPVRPSIWGDRREATPLSVRTWFPEPIVRYSSLVRPM